MNAPFQPDFDAPAEAQSEWHEAFPEPQTIPMGWDSSAIPPAVFLAAAPMDPEAEILSV